jgi:phytanoyl-CoA hydroxylase
MSSLALQFKEDGYLVVPDVVSKEDLKVLSDELATIARGGHGKLSGMVPAQKGASDIDIMKKYVSFHHPHKLSKRLVDVGIKHPRIVEILREIVSPNVKCMQSKFFVNGPKTPGQAWRQDELDIPTRDRSLTAVWIALDDFSVDSGCPWVHPGSHKSGVLYPMRAHTDPRFDSTDELHGFPQDADGGVPVECNAGSVVFFHGYVIHRTFNNKTDGFGKSFVAHHMSAESFLPWDCNGSIPATVDNRDVFMVAGRDPHAHKGYRTGNTFPFGRPLEGKAATEGKDGKPGGRTRWTINLLDRNKR